MYNVRLHIKIENMLPFFGEMPYITEGKNHKHDAENFHGGYKDEKDQC